MMGPNASMAQMDRSPGGPDATSVTEMIQTTDG